MQEAKRKYDPTNMFDLAESLGSDVDFSGTAATDSTATAASGKGLPGVSEPQARAQVSQ